MSLEGRRVLITGASSGIGRACAILAAQLGAQVVLVARRRDLLEDLRRELVSSDRHLVLPCDLSDSVAYEPLFCQATASGKLDGLVHAAGIGPACPIGFLSEEELAETLQVNSVSWLRLIRLASKTKYRNSFFSAVAVSSISALAGWPGASLYAASKGAVSASVRALAAELAPRGIRVNAICPGHVKTPMFNAMFDGLPEEAQKHVLARQPLGLGLPVQVANAVCFLLSDAASLITGVNLPVDGGYTAL